MKYILLCLLLVETAMAASYSYVEDFEGPSQPVRFWVKSSSAKYTLDTLGVTTERAFNGTQSLKMTVTLLGDTTDPGKSAYYYWWLPLAPAPNLLDSLSVSAHVWMDSAALQYVVLSPVTAYPPTRVGGCLPAGELPRPSGDSVWSPLFSPRIHDNADGVARDYVYGATHSDFGADMTGLAILIRCAGVHRVTLFLDAVRISGRIMDSTAYADYKRARWSSYKLRVDSIVHVRQNAFDSLAPVPDTSGHVLSALGNAFCKQLYESRTVMSGLLREMDSLTALGSTYFPSVKMDSLEERLTAYPGLVSALRHDLDNASSQVTLYGTAPTKYFQFTGQNLPPWSTPLSTLAIRACRGEYEPAEIILAPKKRHPDVRCQWGPFTGSRGTLPASVLDVRIAKLWYQANNPAVYSTGKGVKTLAQELLVRDDSLVLVNTEAGTNRLRMRTKAGTVFYADISTPDAPFPDTALVYDADALLPFCLDSTLTKNLWLTWHVPVNAEAGTYNGRLWLVTAAAETLARVPVELEVLPFDLDSSRLTYSLYYEARLTTGALPAFQSAFKDSSQLRCELTDMKEHGVLYPVCYQTAPLLGRYLTLSGQTGLPRDRLFSCGIFTGNAQTQTALTAKKREVAAFCDSIRKYGYDSLFVYGADEVSGSGLAAQRPAWQAVHDTGAFVFVAGYDDLLDSMGALIDIGVIASELKPDYALRFHQTGNRIFSYANPQVGVENPEVYRCHYGFALWKAGYDGAMDWAYQRNYAAFWNDFDSRADAPTYREEVFTYPTSNGVVPTIQWEGFREAVDDIRYLSTLLNRIDADKKLGRDMTAYEAWVNAIDPEADPDRIRGGIIDKLLSLEPSPVNKTRAAWHPYPLSLTIRPAMDGIYHLTYANPSASEKTVMAVYGVDGRHIETLFTGKTGAGPHTLSWKPRDLAAGTYFVRLTMKPGGRVAARLVLRK